jgi:predicted nucleic acid-binding protein
VRVLVDINVVLDVLLDRRAHVEASAAVWTAIEGRHSEGLLSAHAITTIHYLIRKEAGVAKAKQTIAAILRVFGIAGVDSSVIHDALELRLADFEDAVTVAAAQHADCGFIITGNLKDFRGSPIRCLAPEEAAPLLRRE